MISRPVAIVAALLLGACSKTDPGTSTTTSAVVPGSPTTTTAPAASGAPARAGAAPQERTVDDDHNGHPMGGMPSSIPMQGHMHDGGMGHPMPDHPMPR